MKTKMRGKSSQDSLDLHPNNVLESIDSELTFYRHRIFTIFSSVATLQILLVTGQQTIKIKNDLWANVAYTATFIVLVVVTALFNSAYKMRIYSLRRSKINLCNQFGFNDVFPEPHSKLSPSGLYVLTIAMLSLIGIVIVWLGK